MKSFLILFLLSNLFCFGETESEFTSLFDGKTLKGWLASPGEKWEVKDGVLLGTSQKTDKRHGILFSEKEYSDFILRAKFRVLLGNSGFYSVPRTAIPPFEPTDSRRKTAHRIRAVCMRPAGGHG